MNEVQVKQMIIDKVKVTPHMVVLAKGLINSAIFGVVSSKSLEELVLSANDVYFPKEIRIHPSYEVETELKQVSLAFSWQLATVEAIWSLIHSGAILPHGNTTVWTLQIGWTTTAIEGGGGTSSGWEFPELSVFVPVQVRSAHSRSGGSDQILVNGDIFLHSLNIDKMHVEVASAIREAIKCFRSELFTASVAMLGKASEGAWLELGKSLIDWIPNEYASKFAKQVQLLEDTSQSTIKKIEAVKEIYNNRDVFKSLEKTSEVTMADLRVVSAWSDAIRDSRNTIHFGVAPALPNSHEKVSSLLIASVPHLRVLYQLRSAAVASIFSRDSPGVHLDGSDSDQ